MESNLFDEINLRWLGKGHKTAIVFEGEEYSYDEIRDKTNELIIALTQLNVHEGTKIALISKNNIFSVLLILACAKIGALCAPINDELNIDQKEVQLETINPSLCIVESSRILDLLEQKFSTHCSFILLSTIEESCEQRSEMDLSICEKLCKWDSDFLLTSSSGSTGKPKPIVFSQRVKLLRAKSAILIWNLNSKSVVINASPLHHSLGQRHLFIALLSQSTLVLMKRFRSSDWIDMAIKYNANFAIPVTTHLRSLFSEERFKSIILSGQFKAMVSSSAELSQDMREIMSQSPTNFYEMYGASEIGTATIIKLDDQSPINSVGKAIKNCEIIIHHKDSDSSKTVNDIGEICVVSPYAFTRYLGKTKTPMLEIAGNQYFKTGDLGWIDANGFLYYAGRIDDRVNVGGISVYLNDVSDSIKRLDFVVDVAIVGIYDDYFGMVPAAAVVLDSEHRTIAELNETKIIRKITAFLASNLSPYQLPRIIKIYIDLPLLSSGKIDKKLLTHELKKDYDLINKK